MTDEPRERARRLERRLTEASEAAERLISEAARAGRAAEAGGDAAAGEAAEAGGSRTPPPAGWQAPTPETPRSELDALLHAVHALRELIPPEVVERVAAAIRELLLALRGLIDYYLERLESEPEQPVEVEDIPIQ